MLDAECTVQFLQRHMEGGHVLGNAYSAGKAQAKYSSTLLAASHIAIPTTANTCTGWRQGRMLQIPDQQTFTPSEENTQCMYPHPNSKRLTSPMHHSEIQPNDLLPRHDQSHSMVLTGQTFHQAIAKTRKVFSLGPKETRAQIRTVTAPKVNIQPFQKVRCG